MYSNCNHCSILHNLHLFKLHRVQNQYFPLLHKQVHSLHNKCCKLLFSLKFHFGKIRVKNKVCFTFVLWDPSWLNPNRKSFNVQWLFVCATSFSVPTTTLAGQEPTGEKVVESEIDRKKWQLWQLCLCPPSAGREWLKSERHLSLNEVTPWLLATEIGDYVDSHKRHMSEQWVLQRKTSLLNISR